MVVKRDHILPCRSFADKGKGIRQKDQAERSSKDQAVRSSLEVCPTRVIELLTVLRLLA